MTTPKRTIDLLAELAHDPANGLVQIADGWYEVKRHPDITKRPLVRAAIVGLDAWGIGDPEAAKAVLSWWRHYDELTPEDLAEVIEHYVPPCEKCGRVNHDGTEDHELIRDDGLDID